MKQADSVLVTRVDNNHVTWAKQLFSSVWHTAGWRGDMLLLAHDIEPQNLLWFRSRGIFVKSVRPLYTVGAWPSYAVSKLYIFQPWIKKWHHVVYVDPDVIVNGSLDALRVVRGFAVAPELNRQPLFDQFLLETPDDWKLFFRMCRKLRRSFRLTATAFNIGVIAMNTGIIKHDTFATIDRLLRMIRPICRYAEQTALNIYFYRRWQPLASVYNLHPLLYRLTYRMPSSLVRAIVFHFAGMRAEDKPSHPKHLYHAVWKENVRLADEVSRTTAVSPVHRWTTWQITGYEALLWWYRVIRGREMRRYVYSVRIWMRYARAWTLWR